MDGTVAAIPAVGIKSEVSMVIDKTSAARSIKSRRDPGFAIISHSSSLKKICVVGTDGCWRDPLLFVVVGATKALAHISKWLVDDRIALNRTIVIVPLKFFIVKNAVILVLFYREKILKDE